jgi:hypothetical protein
MSVFWNINVKNYKEKHRYHLIDTMGEIIQHYITLALNKGLIGNKMKRMV